MIGIIGGSGVYNIKGIEFLRDITFDTPYGAPSDSFMQFRISGTDVIFLARHGSTHSLPPHKINYRANIWGLRELGVKRIVATGAVGGINMECKPGDLVIVDQIINMAHGRASTFYDKKGDVTHIDFTNPYCRELRLHLIESAEKLNLPVHRNGTYICTPGPRLETKAEINYYSIIGADVVGMTGMPEACLARELEICYTTIAAVTNYAAGIGKTPLTAREVINTMGETQEKLNTLISKAVQAIPAPSECECRTALRDAKV